MVGPLNNGWPKDGNMVVQQWKHGTIILLWKINYSSHNDRKHGEPTQWWKYYTNKYRLVGLYNDGNMVGMTNA